MGNLKAEHRGHRITSRERVDTGLQWPVVPCEMSQRGPRGTWASCCVSATQRPIPFLGQGARREGWRCLFPTWFSNLSKKRKYNGLLLRPGIKTSGVHLLSPQLGAPVPGPPPAHTIAPCTALKHPCSTQWWLVVWTPVVNSLCDL